MFLAPSMRVVPQTSRDWDEFFRGVKITPDDGSTGTPQLQHDAVTNEVLRNSSPLSVIGRPQDTPGDPADIAASVGETFLVRRGTALGFGPVVDSDVPDTIARGADVTEEINDAIAALNIASGTYTPTITNASNLDASTAYDCQWMRIGSVVTVSGRVDADATTTATDTQLLMTLPIASNIGAEQDLGGVAFSPFAAGEGAAIWGDPGSNKAFMRWVATSTVNQAFAFSFTYAVI